MKKKVLISPSLLSADFGHLQDEIDKVVALGADFLHFDVMDGHFVHNFSLGIPVIKSVSRTHHLINDVHIMINQPLLYAESFIKAGADILTFHLETCATEREVFQVIDEIVKYGAKPALSVKPGTAIESVFPFLEKLFLVLVMSVEPGFGGQAFMPSALERISILNKEILARGVATLIEVDGGINEITGPQCISAGADILVVGNYLFGHKDIDKRFKALKG